MTDRKISSEPLFYTDGDNTLREKDGSAVQIRGIYTDGEGNFYAGLGITGLHYYRPIEGDQLDEEDQKSAGRIQLKRFDPREPLPDFDWDEYDNRYSPDSDF